MWGSGFLGPRESKGYKTLTVEWIRAGLKHTGKTRSGLAKALGRSPSAVTDLLNGHRRLRADEIAIVAEYLGIEPPRLLGGGDSDHHPRRRSSVTWGPARSRISTPTDRARSTRSRRQLDAQADHGRRPDPRPFPRRAVRRIARILRRHPQSA